MVADEPKIWDTSFILFNTLPPCLPVSLLDKCHFQSLMVKVLRHISMCLKTLLHLLDLYFRTTDISQNLQKMPPCNPPPPYQQKNFTWLLSVSDLTTVLYQTRKLNDFVISRLVPNLKIKQLSLTSSTQNCCHLQSFSTVPSKRLNMGEDEKSQHCFFDELDPMMSSFAKFCSNMPSRWLRMKSHSSAALTSLTRCCRVGGSPPTGYWLQLLGAAPPAHLKYKYRFVFHNKYRWMFESNTITVQIQLLAYWLTPALGLYCTAHLKYV